MKKDKGKEQNTLGDDMRPEYDFSALISMFFLYLNSQFDLFQKSGVGIAIPGLSREHINNLLFPLLPLNEQKRIVAKVETFLRLCDDLYTQLSQVQQDREALLYAVLYHALQ